MSASVTVIIAVYNAQGTVARAIRSAVSQPEVAEIIVVDDASWDRTCEMVEAEIGRDARVRLIRQEVNQGPAAARNRALRIAKSDYLAVLDSDDVFLPGRLGRLLACHDGDMVADNIAFVTPANLPMALETDWSAIRPEFTALGAAEFVQGNLHTAGVSRGELGFLKPVLSRLFLLQHDLHYDPTLRLGEDYDLYVRMLLAGARMRLTRRPGYAAVVRPNSLSARHGAAELGALRQVLEAHLAAGPHPSDLMQAMRAHLRQVRHKHDHRMFLDLRRSRGAWAALGYLFGDRERLWLVSRQIARDKLGISTRARDAAPETGVRLLLPA